MADEKKYLDNDGLLYVKQKIAGKYVAKEPGKGLSTNDYTTEEKNKLAGLTATKVDTVKVNGTALTPDSDKAVDVTVPTKVSDLTNDGDGTTGSKFATESYVNTNGGKIDKIKVNNAEQTITDKTVNITVPTKTSDLANDDNVVKDAFYVHTDNNFTNAKDNKLTGIETGAQVNTIEDIKVNGTSQVIVTDGKYVDITVPTNNNQLTNGAGYQTASDVNTAIANAIGDIQGISYSVVQTLPAKGEAGTIYLVSNSGSGSNIYDEYLWVNNAFEKIGTTEVDLSGYVQESELIAITNAEIDAIFED